MPYRALILLLACLTCWSSPLPGGADTTIIGGKTRAIDGDTLEIKGQRVRLQGIDAPEKGQSCRDASGKSYPCGVAATEALRHRVGGSDVSCALEPERDRYERALGVCSVDGADLNAWLVAQGHALAHRRYSLEYVDEEEAARAGRRGIWAGDFVAPWDWRRGERLPASKVSAEGEFDALALYDDNGNGRITCKEARAHGVAPVSRDHPAYRYMDDRDGDGVVCE